MSIFYFTHNILLIAMNSIILISMLIMDFCIQSIQLFPNKFPILVDISSMFGSENQTVESLLVEAKSIYTYVESIPSSFIFHRFHLLTFVLELNVNHKDYEPHLSQIVKLVQSDSLLDIQLVEIQVCISTRSALPHDSQPIGIYVFAPTLIISVGWNKTKFIINASQSHLLLAFDYDYNDVQLVAKAKIKANRRFFNSIAAANKYVETFTFEEDCLYVHIDAIENCKKKITIKSTAYT